MTSKPKTTRPKQTTLPLKGKGVEGMNDKKLIALADEFVDLRDKKAELATELGNTEKKILERMAELKITKFRFSDQIAEIKEGAEHVKIKTVKTDPNDEETAESPGAGELGDKNEQ